MVGIKLKECCIGCKHPHISLEVFEEWEERSIFVNCDDAYLCELMDTDNGKWLDDGEK